MRLGYVTNGFRDHSLDDCFDILAELGYDGVGITLDHGHLHPYYSTRSDVRAVRDALRRHGLEPVVETGGRFVLDPRRKHYPNLLSAERREERLDFLRRAVELSEALGSRVLSFWSGKQAPEVDRDAAWAFLIAGLRALEETARKARVALAFEPEPGMFIASLDDFRELRERLSSQHLRLTLDLGHLQCTEEPPLDRWVREFEAILTNVHVDDIRGREHRHLPLGEGEIDFPPLFRALDEIGYDGLALVELSRHSHAAPDYAVRSMEFVRRSTATPRGGR